MLSLPRTSWRTISSEYLAWVTTASNERQYGGGWSGRRRAQADSPQYSRLLTFKRQGPERAARLCSNRTDIRWPQPASAGSTPAPVIAIDRAAGSSHRQASGTTGRGVPDPYQNVSAMTVVHGY